MRAGGVRHRTRPPRAGVPANRGPGGDPKSSLGGPRTAREVAGYSFRLQHQPVPQRSARLRLEPGVSVGHIRRYPRAPPRFVQREAELPASFLPSRREPVPRRLSCRFHRRNPHFSQRLVARSTKPGGLFGSPGFAGEFTLMDRDLFRCSPGEGPDRYVQSIGAVHEARTERQALGWLIDVGDSHHSSLGKALGNSMSECCHAAFSGVNPCTRKTREVLRNWNSTRRAASD